MVIANQELLQYKHREVKGSSSKEDLGSSVEVVVLNEHTRGNILSDPRRPITLFQGFSSSVESLEGFSENPEGQVQLADFYIDQINLFGRGDLLGVGFGHNVYIVKQFTKRGIPSFALDLYTVGNSTATSQDSWHPPKVEEITPDGVTLVSGEISALGMEASDLRHHKFGTVLFNGSWDASGFNYTVGGEVLDEKRRVFGINEPYYDYIDHERTAMLQVARDHLRDRGIIGIVSSQYANYGGGYEFEQLPDEKLSFIDLYARFIGLGAQKIYVVGLSQKGFDQVLDISRSRLPSKSFQDDTPYFMRPFSNLQQQNVHDQLRSPAMINVPAQFAGVDKRKNTIEHIMRMQQAVTLADKSSQIRGVARIDALFAEFPSRKSLK